MSDFFNVDSLLDELREQEEQATWEDYENGLDDLIGTSLYNHIERVKNIKEF